MKVMCCFCGESLLSERAMEITLRPPKARESPQALWCHPRCLEARLRPDVPLLSEDDE